MIVGLFPFRLLDWQPPDGAAAWAAASLSVRSPCGFDQKVSMLHTLAHL
jgi:hypothetical protein